MRPSSSRAIATRSVPTDPSGRVCQAGSRLEAAGTARVKATASRRVPAGRPCEPYSGASEAAELAGAPRSGAGRGRPPTRGRRSTAGAGPSIPARTSRAAEAGSGTRTAGCDSRDGAPLLRSTVASTSTVRPTHASASTGSIFARAELGAIRTQSSKAACSTPDRASGQSRRAVRMRSMPLILTPDATTRAKQWKFPLLRIVGEQWSQQSPQASAGFRALG
jgi:hypothetical protein